jgi:cytochrome c2
MPRRLLAIGATGVVVVAAALWLYQARTTTVRPTTGHSTHTTSPGAPDPRSEQDSTATELRAGLLAEYRSLALGEPDTALVRIDRKPAFRLGDSSPHPRIAPGPFEVTWTGFIEVDSDDPVRFDAFVGGELAIEIDGVTVLEGQSDDERTMIESTRAWERGAGEFPIVIRYRSLAGVPARLQIWWQARRFAREPVPAWRLKYDPVQLPEAARVEAQIDAGRAAARRFGCARCHRDAFPGVDDPPPGPSLAGIGDRTSREWLLAWLADPAHLRPGARMPKLFTPDRSGFVERAVIADFLIGLRSDGAQTPANTAAGDHRKGKQEFLGRGCAACHHVPDMQTARHDDPQRFPLDAIGGRTTTNYLATVIANPATRYRDGRMPKLPLDPDVPRHIAAYLELWAKPVDLPAADAAPTANELEPMAKQLGVTGGDPSSAAIGAAIVRKKGCAQCHEGLGESPVTSVPIDLASRNEPRRAPLTPALSPADGGEGEISAAVAAFARPADSSAPRSPSPPSAGERAGVRGVVDARGAAHGSPLFRGCLSGTALPRFELNEEQRQSLLAYTRGAPQERHPSEFYRRQQRLEHLGCYRCHAAEGDAAAPLEEVARTLWAPFLARLPYQRTPRLVHPLAKYNRDHLAAAIRDGVSGVRPEWYTYRMPAFGDQVGEIVRALAETDGEIIDATPVPADAATDPTIAAAGRQLVGFTGYSCTSCHSWSQQSSVEVEPGSIGPELTSITSRIRRDWFDRWLDNPARSHPATAMPSIFRRGEAAVIRSVLDGDAARQKDALWAYLALGKDAPSPQPRPPQAVPPVAIGAAPLVSQIPIRSPDGGIIESITAYFADRDLVLYDVGAMRLRTVYVDARILRHSEGRRSFSLSGTPVQEAAGDGGAIVLAHDARREPPASIRFVGYDRLPDGMRIRSLLRFDSGVVAVAERFSLVRDGTRRWVVQRVESSGLPAGAVLEYAKNATGPTAGRNELRVELPPASPPVDPDEAPSQEYRLATIVRPESHEGSLNRPGYRAVRYPRPHTSSGEDLVMPVGVAADPRSGRLFVASVKMGEVFELDDRDDNSEHARFVNFGGGLFQDAYSMHHDGDSLYVLHRRNLTRVRDTDGDGAADAFDRVYELQHAVADEYDWAYGLARDRAGSFFFGFAPHGTHEQRGSGGVLRLTPGEGEPRVEEVAFGLRNPFGWCIGPDGELFVSDNQGEWVAANKLVHASAGKFFGYPNRAQPQHAEKPHGKAAIWVPYAWARSINGLAYDDSGGKFGPFAGQVFMAELMHGGAIVRASLEKVNGQYQGACFPFWGKGLLGPLTLAFDPRGRLFVGSITEPSWMRQPDRGGLFRIDFTGEVPFEIQSIHAMPRGFRLTFTKPVDSASARRAESYAIEHFRYEYTAAYGSPELDRQRLGIERVELQTDARSVVVTTAPLADDRVYMINAAGLRSAAGEALVHPTGAYTMNEVPHVTIERRE